MRKLLGLLLCAALCFTFGFGTTGCGKKTDDKKTDTKKAAAISSTFCASRPNRARDVSPCVTALADDARKIEAGFTAWPNLMGGVLPSLCNRANSSNF